MSELVTVFVDSISGISISSSSSGGDGGCGRSDSGSGSSGSIIHIVFGLCCRCSSSSFRYFAIELPSCLIEKHKTNFYRSTLCLGKKRPKCFSVRF